LRRNRVALHPAAHSKLEKVIAGFAALVEVAGVKAPGTSGVSGRVLSGRQTDSDRKKKERRQARKNMPLFHKPPYLVLDDAALPATD
jgi:hypothetical protein